MPQQDTNDLLTAFAIGTALGVGATLLLRPRPKTARERLMRELKPGRRGVTRPVPADAVRVRRPADVEGASAMADEVISVGRELLDEFRDEVQRILADARDQLRQGVEAEAPLGENDDPADGFAGAR